MWAIPTGTGSILKKKKNQVVSPSPESRVPETCSDPPIGSGREPGRDKRAEFRAACRASKTTKWNRQQEEGFTRDKRKMGKSLT